MRRKPDALEMAMGCYSLKHLWLSFADVGIERKRLFGRISSPVSSYWLSRRSPEYKRHDIRYRVIAFLRIVHHVS
jgi:hypothetical protein